jgi:adenosylmethionine-8-amino-7-oxononanoate aminotransferase
MRWQDKSVQRKGLLTPSAQLLLQCGNATQPLKLHAKIKTCAMDNGLMIYPMGGTVDGQWDDHILLAPPFIMTKSDIDQIVDLLAKSIEQSIPALLEV